MYNFFVDRRGRHGDQFFICGSDYNHIVNVLRMQPGDKFLVSCDGESCLCSLEHWEDDTVVAQIIEENVQNTELPVKIYLFQGLPKSDKMELIIQKTVELGVAGIIPVEMKRCVMKLEENYRAVIHLYYYEGYSIKEIASILKVPSATVGTRLKRGREKLRKMLEGDVSI